MYCWRARREMASLGADRPRRGLADHVASCAACREEMGAMSRMAEAVAAAGASGAPDAPDDFEARVLRAARSRPASAARSALPALGGPLPVAASLVVMVAAGVVAASLAGRPPGDPRTPPSHTARETAAVAGAEDWPVDADDAVDRLLPPPEIPFTVHEDLVGARRGRIPVTTYVLEPPPDETAVMRASL